MTQAREPFVGGSVPRKEDSVYLTGMTSWTDNTKLLVESEEAGDAGRDLVELE